MIVRLVAHGDFLFSDFLLELAVHFHPHTAGGRLALLPEDVPHVVEERGGGGEDGAVEAVQKGLGVLIALFRRQLQPVDGLGLILRDIMAGETPFVLKKHVYACASISGACLYVILLQFTHSDYAMLFGAFLVVAIRMLASHYRWNLPGIKKE